MAIGFHGAWNLWQGTVFGARLSGQKGVGGVFVTEINGPARLTGDLFGVETSCLSVPVRPEQVRHLGADHEDIGGLPHRSRGRDRRHQPIAARHRVRI